MSIQVLDEQLFSHFRLKIKQHPNYASIKMVFHTDFVNTKEVPSTYKFLQNLLPSVLRSTCYNRENLPFFEEVKKTELGHLYEHILLEYLCKLKIQKGFKKAVFKGKTHWNWSKDPMGTFHITATSGKNDADILNEAVKQANDLMSLLLKESKKSNKTYKQVSLRSPVYMMMG